MLCYAIEWHYAQTSTGTMTLQKGSCGPVVSPRNRGAVLYGFAGGFWGKGSRVFLAIEGGEPVGTAGGLYRPWLRLVAMAVASAGIGLLAALWGSEAWAGVLGAAVAAVVSVVAVGIQTERQRQAEAVRRRPRALEIPSPAGRFPLVRDLHDPVAVGVHPAETIEQDGAVDRVPAYITRDMEPHLHAALRRGGFVLLVGESTAGKTRAASRQFGSCILITTSWLLPRVRPWKCCWTTGKQPTVSWCGWMTWNVSWGRAD